MKNKINTLEEARKSFRYKNVRLSVFESDFEWNEISKMNLSRDFIRKYNESIKWFSYSLSDHFDKFVLDEFADKIEWETVSIHQTFTEEEIEKYINKLDLNFISSTQTLSEAFIEKHLDILNLERIATSQELSLNFILNNLDRIDLLTFYYQNQKNNWSQSELKTLDEIFHLKNKFAS